MRVSPKLALSASVTALVLYGSLVRAQTVNLCQGLPTNDKSAHPMTPLAKPAVGQAVIDPQFGTVIRRITAVPDVGSNPVIKTMYSTIPAWNADESLLILYRVGYGHLLYDGRTYQYIRALDIDPADLEQVYWHTTDPDILFYVDYNQLIRYHVSNNHKEVVRTFSFCSWASGGSDPMFMSWDSNRIGLECGSERFIYDIATNSLPGQKTMSGGVPQMSASGNLAFLDGDVTDAALNTVRTLDLGNPWDHASLGRLANGRDTYNGVAFDPGPLGSDVGTLVTFDMTDGSHRVIVGPATGYPYPPSGTHVSAVAPKSPGWVAVSIKGDVDGQGVLDNELLLADTNTGNVCRIAHHRSWGKSNTHLGTPYWAEPHAVISPTGTRVLFASDWGNGSTVDTYVVELPSYSDTSVYILDSHGGVHLGGGATAMSPATPYFGFDVARGLELTGTGGCLVLDSFGGVHTGGSASAGSPATPYFGFDIARDIELAATGYYVLDGFGGVHAGGGASTMSPATPYFGFDIARDMELGVSGYYVLDGFGGVHIGGGATTLSPATPYFGFDIARDLELAATGHYVIDGFGGVHAGGGAPAMNPAIPYFGFDILRDMELLDTGFYALDGWGGIHAGGGAPTAPIGTPYFGSDVARDLEVHDNP